MLRARRVAIGPAAESRRRDRSTDGDALPSRGGFLEQVDEADWRALGVPPRELRQMDPQQRLLLEVAFEALEDAGLTRRDMAGSRTAVVCGVLWDDYLRLLSRDKNRMDGYAVLGNVSAFAANRVSHRFDLRGASYTINAACASGLIALHEACLKLRSGEAEMALAGAAELMLSADSDRMMRELGVISPSGTCRPLDARADGFVRGEGAAMLVLKPLSKVLPHERVYACVAGGAANHNGRNEWMMATSSRALRDAIEQACGDAGIPPGDLAAVELHGAGAARGDQLEVQALSEAMGTARREPCRIGSIKGNLGHLGAVSGLASVIKAALSLEVGEWLPTAGLDEVSADLESASRQFRPQLEPRAMRLETPIAVGVTATSLGGANCHVILTNAPAVAPKVRQRGICMVPVSAATTAALHQRVAELAAWLNGHPNLPFEDVAFTCRFGRDGGSARAVFFAANREELLQALSRGQSIDQAPEELRLEAQRFLASGELSGPRADDAWGRICSLPRLPWQRQTLEKRVEVPAETTSEEMPLSDFLLHEVQSILQLPEKPDIDASFFDLGLNSMLVVQLRERVERKFGLRLSAAAFFESPTIRALASRQKAAASAPATRQPDAGEPIAIIGMGCRFPGGADTPELLWQLLNSGVDALGPVPRERFGRDLVARMNLRRAAFLEQVDGFDAAFFRISPREAQQMDPQQRLFLEVAWEALENAGIDPASLQESASGVYTGIFGTDYAQAGAGREVDSYYYTGIGNAFAANRLSFCLGLQGPSLAVDTACSSSLVAVHLAVRALRQHECALALAGGVSLMLAPEIGEFLASAGALSPTGTCWAFDRDADGMARGEGCGVVVLKRLRDAEKAGDRVLAVIRGTAMNHGGASGGLTVPNPAAQAQLYRTALRDAGLDAAEIAHLETHGTGTRLGDAVELRGIAGVYGTKRELPLRLGALKASIGHTDAAAGIAGLIKSVLILRHGTVPAQMNFLSPTPEFDWEAYAIEVARKPAPLEGKTVAVSAFGLGGTNAHVILSAAKSEPGSKSEESGGYLLALSARDAPALRELAAGIVGVLENDRQLALQDICATAARSRASQPYRLAVAGRDRVELIQKLKVWRDDAASRIAEVARPAAWKMVFVFSGQGGQRLDMGSELLRENEAFAAKIHEIDALFRPRAGHSILPCMNPGEEDASRTSVAQPALFAMQLGLAAVWHSHGVRPDAVIGHSMGEIAAAVVAGSLRLADAVKVIHYRSHLLDDAAGEGVMVSAALSAKQAAELERGFSGRVSVAAVNGPKDVVLSCERSERTALLGALEERDIYHRELKVNYASHCRLMDRFSEPLQRALEGIGPSRARIAMYSTVTAERLDGSELDAAYWAANLRQRVRFQDAVERATRDGANAFVELSAHPVLGGSIAACLEEAVPASAIAGSLKRGAPERVALLESFGALHTGGYPVDLAAVVGDGEIVDLPRYPWQRKRFWLPKSLRVATAAGALEHPLLGRKVVSPLAAVQYANVISKDSPSWLAGHALRGRIYLPMSAILEMAFAAARAQGLAPAVMDLKVLEPLRLQEKTVNLQSILEARQGPTKFTLYAEGEQGKWTVHATASIGEVAPAANRAYEDRGFSEEVDVSEFYERLAYSGYQYESDFRAIERLTRGAACAMVEVSALPKSGFAIHPAALDGCMQAALALVPPGLYLPASIESAALVGECSGRLRCVAANVGKERFDLRIDCVATGETVAWLQGFELKLVQQVDTKAAEWKDWLYRLRWIVSPGEAVAAKFVPRVLVLGDAWPELVRTAEENGHSCDWISGCEAETGIAELLEGERGRIAHVVFLCGESDSPSTPSSRLFERVLRLAQVLDDREHPARLWVVTRGAQALGACAVDVAQAGLWGLGRVIARELPRLSCTLVDLDRESCDPAMLVREWSLVAGESQVMLRRGVRYVARLERLSLSSDVLAPFKIGLTEYGRMDQLQPIPLQVPSLTSRGVLIRPSVVPLNFRDALNALGMLPEFAAELGIEDAARMPFGFECGGVVEAAGAEVAHVAAGDRVAAGPIQGALASLVAADADRVFKVPASMLLDQVASLVVVYMTASYGLEHLAQLKRGERVLIHAATGGVGLMALQLARLAGAEIFATAHPRKWKLLRSLGVRHTFNSRDTRYADEILARTAGGGVDVVLNSLSAEHIEAGLRVCGERGRFIELGKRGIWTREQVSRLRPGIRYEAFTFSEIADRIPGLVKAMQQELLSRLASGEIEPLPLEHFDARDACEAFRCLSQSRHIGKVVLDMPPAAGNRIDSDGCYLITGGNGALGLEVAGWMVARGATHLVLTGRRMEDEALSLRLAQLRASGGRVEYRPCDVADAGGVDRLIERLREDGAKLRGIMHAAGAIDDAPLQDQTVERFERVLGPKARAVEHLRRATAECELDFFVLFSSTAALLGTAGQANYAAANAMMDAQAQAMRSLGIRALSVQWGPWADSGLAAALDEGTRRALESRGMSFMAPETALAALDALMAHGVSEAAVVPVDWNRYVASLPPDVPTALFAELCGMPPRTHDTLLAGMERLPIPQRHERLQAFVRDQIAKALGLPGGGSVGVRQRLFELGVDSLIAVELRHRLESALEKPLRPTLLFDFPRVDALTRHLADDVLRWVEPASAMRAEEHAPLATHADWSARVDAKLAAVAHWIGEDA